MSVLACDRHGCDNMMCDRYSWKRQEYLCNACFDALVNLGPGTDLDAFMAGKYRGDEFDHDASRAYFDTKYPLSR